MSGKRQRKTQDKPRCDITGNTYGHLIVRRMERSSKSNQGFVAICDCLRCGKQSHETIPARLKSGHTTSCGCLGTGQKEDYTGKRFGYLEIKEVVREYHKEIKKYKYYGICHCHLCGNDNFQSLIFSIKNGRTTSCGCRTDQYIKNTGENSVQFTGYKEIRGQKWYRYKKKAKERGFDFDIKIEEAWALYQKQNRRCKLSGVPIAFGTNEAGSTASLDRIDSKKGYHIDNCQWVHKDVNIMKNVFDMGYFVELCTLISEQNKCQALST